MKRFIWRVVALFRRRRLSRELDDEIAAHLELAAADLEARGLSPDEARQQALREFGAVSEAKERYRESLGFRWIEVAARRTQATLRAPGTYRAFAAGALIAIGLTTLAQEGHMNVFVALVLPGVLGGLLLAVLLARWNQRAAPALVVRKLEPISPDAINMAHIRVAGVGGLGMMAASVVIAVYVPEIGFALLTSIGLGTLGAVALIVHRSHVDRPPSITLGFGPTPTRRAG
jgi:hypothetical protein